MKEHQDLGPDAQEASEPGGEADTGAAPPAIWLKLRVPGQWTARALLWEGGIITRQPKPISLSVSGAGALRGGRGSPGGPRGSAL